MQLFRTVLLLVQVATLLANSRQKRLVLHADTDIAQEIVKLRADMAVLNNTIEIMNHSHNAEIERLKRTHTDDIARLMTNVTATTKGLIQQLTLKSGSPVAFHAINMGGETSHVGLDQNIKFPTVMLNLGAGYHNLSGVFIAPAAGIYIFSTSIMSIRGDSELHVTMMKYGVALARSNAHGVAGYHDQGSISVVAHLAVNDEIFVREYYINALQKITGGRVLIGHVRCFQKRSTCVVSVQY